MNDQHPPASRRDFLKKAAVAATAFYIVPRHVLGGKGYLAPSDKLNIAGIGCGGKGRVDVTGAWNGGTENIVALCDVDDRQVDWAAKKWPNAKVYRDYRRMLDAEKNIDAVTITTADHTHAVIGMAAMQRGKHVYIQKPLAHNLHEVRMLTEGARRYKSVSQMGNQGASGDGVRRFVEWFDAGVIGDCDRVHVWTNRPVWPQGIPKPTGQFDVPKELDWDLWLGPAAYEPYNPAYHPFNWRGWVAYGTGALGDMGCHMMDPPYRALKLGYPSEVECSAASVYSDFFKEAFYTDGFPSASVIHLKFPRPGHDDVRLTWYDGGILPERPDAIPADVQLGDPNGGVLMIGKKGVLMCGLYGNNPTAWPEKRAEKAAKVKQTLPRIPGADREGHYQHWLTACKAGFDSPEHRALSSSFDYAGPMTEAVIMGNLAIRSFYLRDGKGFPGRKKLLWDGPNMKITNFDEANQFVTRRYRDGWSLGA